jgi:FSR family fosmidomycin resistance protein-like MFS transporter
MMAGASSFLLLLAAFTISNPASGAFVSLSQATLMDLNPGREPHSMARWTVFGSLGNLAGPALLAGAFLLGLGWRWPFVGLALLALGLVFLLWRRSFPPRHAAVEEHAPSLRTTPAWMWGNLTHALRSTALLRWVALLEFADLLMDVLTGYVALYFADVAGLNPAQTSLMLMVLMLASLSADLILIPLLERAPGRSIVRLSAVCAIPLYIGFLLAPWVWGKVVLLAGVRLSTLGWYQVLQGEAYAAVPGRSGTVAAVNSAAGVLGGALVWVIGLAADRIGLSAAMWLLLAAPVTLVIFVPAAQK